ncbi:HigA family addiction module antitoxin [Avibacterium paragallinarum]|uniref:HigA family addiction module antitoxin n=1 Tax=Avibacterium paragallinarum TaxID=728 RepID=UPI00397AFC30
MHNPAHPGEILREYIEGFSVTEIAQKLGVARVTLSRILNTKAAVSPEMALRLSKLLNTSPEFWLTMQANYDLQQAHQRINITITPLFN